MPRTSWRCRLTGRVPRYERCTVRFDWRAGDVLMLDNMLVAHARDPYQGPRKIVVAMSELVERSQFANTASA
jgi:hypothetical protein